MGAALSARLQAAVINSTSRLALCNTNVNVQLVIELECRPAFQAALNQQGIFTVEHYPTLPRPATYASWQGHLEPV
jgi:hypothetical protein